MCIRDRSTTIDATAPEIRYLKIVNGTTNLINNTIITAVVIKPTLIETPED